MAYVTTFGSGMVDIGEAFTTDGSYPSKIEFYKITTIFLKMSKKR